MAWNTRYLVLRGTQLLVFGSKQEASRKQNALELLEIVHGKIENTKELFLSFETKNPQTVFVAKAFTKADLAKWITAFYRLAIFQEEEEEKQLMTARLSPLMATSSSLSSSDSLVGGASAVASDGKRMFHESPTGLEDFENNQLQHEILLRTQSDLTSPPPPPLVLSTPTEEEEEALDASEAMELCSDENESSSTNTSLTSERDSSGSRRVSFFESVHVRFIPSLPKEQVSELFYSKEEMKKFTVQAGSLLSRTEDIMQRAVSSIRRPFKKPKLSSSSSSSSS